MARRFVVRTDYKANGDQVVKTHGRMSRSFGRFATQLSDGNSVVGRSFGNLNKTINRVAMIGMTALVAGAGLAAREFINLDNSITAAGAKFVDIDSSAETFQENLSMLSAAARAVGADTEFAATDAAGALDKFAMAGLDSQQSMALLRGTTDLATAAGADLTTAVDIATDSLGAFNLEVGTAEQAQASLARVSDVMAQTTTSANTSLTELFEAIKSGGPAFTAAGQSVETFNAFAGILANAGIKGSEAGTSLRNVMLRLSKPTGDAAKILDQLGVSTQDSQGNFRDAIDILADFEKGLNGMGSAQRTAALTTVFGARSVTGINILLAEGSDALSKYRDELIGSAGAANQMAEAIRGSLGNQIQVLKSGLIELGLQFVEAFEKDGRGALQGLIEFVQQVDITPLIRFSQVMVTIFTFIGKHWRLLVSIAAGVKAVSAAMAVLSIVTQVFNVTLAASPVGIAIAAIAALVTILTLLALNWESVTAWVSAHQKEIAILTPLIITLGAGIWVAVTATKALGISFASLGAPIIAVAAVIGLLVSGIVSVVAEWENVKKAFSERGIGAGLLAIGGAFVSGLLLPLQALLELASKIPGIGNLAESGAQRIRELRDSLAGEELAAIGSPETPTPGFPGAGAAQLGSGRLDININNNAGDNAEFSQSGDIPTGTRINMKPAISF